MTPAPPPPRQARVTLDLMQRLIADAPPAPPRKPRHVAQADPAAPAPASGRRPVKERKNFGRRVAGYMRKLTPAVMGQYGSNPTYWAARVLVTGFGFSIAEALLLLEQWNQTHCHPPWSEHELMHKLEDAHRKPCELPYEWIITAWENGDDSGPTPPPFPADGRAAPSADASPESPPAGPTVPPPAPADPLARGPGVDALEPRYLAETFLIARYHVQGDPVDYRLVHQHGRYLAWSAGAYRVLEDDGVSNAMNRHAENEAHRDHQSRLQDWRRKSEEKEGDPGKMPVRAKVTRTTVADAVAAVRCRVALSPSVVAPCWLTPGERPEPRAVISTTRGIINTESGEVLPLTPELFTLAATPHYHPDAEPPTNSVRFLEQSIGDQESIDTLFEFAGYVMTPDTSLQRFLYLQGPPGGGKGTVVKMLAGLVGEEFVAATTFNDLSGDHGVADLVGKTLATMGEVRVGVRTDVAAGLVRLLSITGEDAVSVNQKNRPVVSVRLPVRFVVAANELPAVRDSSSALASRAIVLRFPRRFRGTKDEDPTLEKKLMREMPGLFMLALAGLRRLHQRGQFVQPRAAAHILRNFAHATSPLRQFVDERCVVGPRETVPMGDLFAAFRCWCERENHPFTMSNQQFGGNLENIVDGLGRAHPRIEDRRVRMYVGIRLATDEDPDPHAAEL